MEPVLLEMFEQARKLVVDTDRRLAEENDRIREKEREAKLLELSHLIEAAFDFTSKEKLELDPRLDLQDSKPTVEFIVRSLRAIFVMSPQPNGIWTLHALEDGRSPQSLGEFQGIQAVSRSPDRNGNRKLGAKGTATVREEARPVRNVGTLAGLAGSARGAGAARADLRHHGEIPRLLEGILLYQSPPLGKCCFRAAFPQARSFCNPPKEISLSDPGNQPLWGRWTPRHQG
jgi:hypothetical protein